MSMIEPLIMVQMAELVSENSSVTVKVSE